MPTQTPRGFPYIVPADHPLEYPVASQQLAEAIDARGLLIANALKAADQTGIANGGSAGITCSLSGLRVGAKVLGLFQAELAPTTGTIPTSAWVTAANLTGGTLVGTAYNNRTDIGALSRPMQVMGVYLFTASAETLSVGMVANFSNGGTWTCFTGTSITLISL